MAYTLKPEIFEMTKWEKPGDDVSITALPIDDDEKKSIKCDLCGFMLEEHGEVKIAPGIVGTLICPGMLVLKGNYGTIKYIDDKTFTERYEPIKE